VKTKIDKDIPIPHPCPTDGKANGYTESLTSMIERLEVGDSFFTTRRTNNIAASRYQLFAKTGLDRQFTRRKVTENGVTGTRVWRTA
jgi:hypothetical protein